MTQNHNARSTPSDLSPSTRPLGVLGASTMTSQAVASASPAISAPAPGTSSAQTLAAALPTWDLLPAQPFIRRIK